MTRKEILDALEGKIDDAARRFAPIYTALNWQWKKHDTDETYVPDALDIARTLRQLLQHLRESDKSDTSVSTGGLCIWIEDSDVGITFEDAFVLTDGVWV